MKNAVQMLCPKRYAMLSDRIVPKTLFVAIKQCLQELVDHLLPATGGRFFPGLAYFVLELSTQEISFGGVDELAPGDELVSNVKYGEENQTNVCDEEVLNAPWDECGETLGDGDDGAESDTVDGEWAATP